MGEQVHDTREGDKWEALVEWGGDEGTEGKYEFKFEFKPLHSGLKLGVMQTFLNCVVLN